MVTTISSTSPLPHPPRRLPVLGDVLGVHASTPVQDSVALAAQLGPIFERVVLGRRFVIVSGADLVEELSDESRFVKHVAPAVAGLRSIGGDGLFTAYSHEPNWRKAHDLLRPAFTQSAMRSYHDIMVDVAGQLVSHWSSRDRVDVSSDMTKLTLETIGRTGFSYSFDSFTRAETHPFVRAMVRTLQHNQRRALLPLPVVGDLVFRRRERRNDADKAFMAELLDDIVRARRDGETSGDGDLLDIMLQAARDGDPNALDEVNIRHQIVTFLIAGHETTSGSLSFALYYLSRHPEMWARARAEVDEVWGADTPSFEQVAKLRFVRRVLDEGLRLWPTAPGYAREARHDTTVGGRSHGRGRLGPGADPRSASRSRMGAGSRGVRPGPLPVGERAGQAAARLQAVRHGRACLHRAPVRSPRVAAGAGHDPPDLRRRSRSGLRARHRGTPHPHAGRVRPRGGSARPQLT
ncbi:cytochrome P450 [Rhodococcus sp. SORGH_AS303]|nr:cytochrome P450 [Rhodococcus sp. SORGH_AS_0303]